MGEGSRRTFEVKTLLERNTSEIFDRLEGNGKECEDSSLYEGERRRIFQPHWLVNAFQGERRKLPTIASGVNGERMGEKKDRNLTANEEN